MGTLLKYITIALFSALLIQNILNVEQMNGDQHLFALVIECWTVMARLMLFCYPTER